jgi:DNA-binding XRE family transcriptional regulator
MSKHVSVVPFRSMSVTDQREWMKARLTEAAAQNRMVRDLADVIEKHQRILVELLAALNDEEQNGDSEQSVEERLEILDAASEVIQAIRDLKSGKFGIGFQEFEGWLKEGESEAEREVNREIQYFLNQYTKHKARLFLKTQQDVAELVGIDRRHISKIESGEYLPQHKTLQKIAQGFGIPVTEFYLNSRCRETRKAP